MIIDGFASPRMMLQRLASHLRFAIALSLTQQSRITSSRAARQFAISAVNEPICHCRRVDVIAP